MSVISYLLLISPLKVLHCLHRVLNSHSFFWGGRMSLDLTNAFIHLRTSVCEFLGIFNQMSSATIFTSAYIAILQLSLHFFLTFVFLPELILKLCYYYCFSLALLITGFHIVFNFYAWSAKEIFVAKDMCWFLKVINFPMVFLVYNLNLVLQRAVISLLSPYVVSLF